MRKYTKYIILTIIFTLYTFNPSFAKATLNVGLILDGETLKYAKPALEKEFNDLSGHKKSIIINDKNVFYADWSKEKATEKYTKLENSKNIDLIIGIGYFTSEAILSEKTITKPTICYGARADIKNKKNLIHFKNNINESLNLKEFKRVYPYNKIAIVSVSETNIKKDKNHIFVEEKNLEQTLNTDKAINAIYLGHLGKTEGEKKKELIKNLVKKGYPVFGYSSKDLKDGALAVVSSNDINNSNLKNIALTIDDYIDYGKLSATNSKLVVKGYTAVNLATANKIQKMPKYEILNEVVLYNENLNKDATPVDIKQVILYALENNLSLSSEKIKSQIAKRENQLAKRSFMPNITFGANLYFIDDEYSKLIHERMGNLQVSVNQLIYSDEAVSGILASKDMQRAQEQMQAQEALTTIKNASNAYLNILKMQNMQKVYKELLDFSHKNLEIAEKSNLYGRTSMSDVYRWKSEFSMNKNNYIQVKANTQKSMYELNRQLNKPIDNIFVPVDIKIKDENFLSFENQQIKNIVDNPIASRDFADFLTQKAINDHPVLKATDKKIKANERMLGFYKRKNFVPTISASAMGMNTVYTGGKGPVTTDNGNRYFGGVFASWSIFDGDKNRVNYHKTKLEMQNIATQKQAIAKGIETKIRAGVLDLAAKSATIDLSKESAEYASKNLELVQKSYDLGKISIVSLLNAKNAQIQAEMKYLDSVYEYLATVVNLQAEVGSFDILSTEEAQAQMYNEYTKYLNNKTNKKQENI
jgi:outer membrane protein TolC